MFSTMFMFLSLCKLDRDAEKDVKIILPVCFIVSFYPEQGVVERGGS